MAMMASKAGRYVWVILPRVEIKEQTIETFKRCEIPLDNIYIGLTITTANKIEKLHKPDLILYDECHISVASTYWKISNAFPEAWIVGATASPIRTDDKPLGDLYQDIVEGVTVRWLINNHFLAPYEYYSVTVADVLSEDGSELMKPTVYGDVIENWKRLAGDKQTVIYCASVKHSMITAEKFREAGIKAEHFDGTTPAAERKKMVDRFKAGEIKVLCNCDLISMGFDMPDIGCVVLLRPTESTALYIQQSGRALRYKPGKVAVIIDMVGNYQKFQLPDEPYEWSLEQSPKKRKLIDSEGNFTVRTCGNCFMVFKTAPVCPYCGCEYKLKPRELKAHEDIELKRITAEEAEKAEQERKQKRKEQGMARSYQELVAIGRERGYKNPGAWAAMVYKSRKR
jgi:superfamily II DNA or RNA helicase